MNQSRKSPHAGDGRRILLVEDDQQIALNQTRLLEHAGYQVTAVYDAASALSQLKLTADQFDLVLMDIDLGHGMDGPQTAREILAIQEIPVMFLSAHSEKNYVERTHGLESYGFVVKNAGASVLLASLSMAFRLWDSRLRQRAEERQYRVLVESSPDIIMRFERDFRYLYVSPSVKLLGSHPPEFFVGKTVSEIGYTEEMQARWENSISNVFFTAQGIEQEIRLQQDGTTLDLNWRLIPEKDEHGRVTTVLSIIRDISPQKRAEAYRFQNELRMAFLLDLYSHAALLSEQEISDRAVRMARELSGSRNGYLHIVGGQDERSANDPLLAECLAKRSQLIHDPDPTQEGGEARAILLPVMERDAVVMVLAVSGKRFAYDDTDRAQLQLAANEVYRMISRRRADEALQESYRQYQSILNTASDGFYMTDENGQFIDANEVYVNMSGYRRSELLKLNIAALERDEEGIEGETHRRLVIAQGKNRHETRQRRKNGRMMDLEISTTYIASSRRFVSFVRDIAERKKVEQNLLRMQHLLSETGRIARIGGWEYTLESKHMTWTDEVYRIHDLSVEFEPTLDRAMAFLEGESLPRFALAFRQIVEKQAPFDLELSIRSANGRIKWVRAIGRPITRLEKLLSVAGTLQDITDQHSANFQVQTSTTRLDQFFNLSLDLLCIIDAEGRFLSLNPAWMKVTGFALAQLEGKRLVDYIHPDDLAKTVETWREAKTQVRSGLVSRIRTSDGLFRWIEWHITPGEDGIYAAARDITETLNVQNMMRLQAMRNTGLLELHRREFISSTDLLCKALEFAVVLTNSSLGYLHMLNGKRQILATYFWSAAHGDGCNQTWQSNHPLLDPRIWADSVRLRRAVIHNDIRQKADASSQPAGQDEILRHMAVPLLIGKTIRMIVGVANKTDPYDDDDSKELGFYLEGLWQLLERRFPEHPGAPVRQSQKS